MHLASSEQVKKAYDSGYRWNAFGRTTDGIVLPYQTFDVSEGGNQGAFCIKKTHLHLSILIHYQL